jgi:hypothetical protein
MALLYTIVSMTAMLGIVSLAVDLGRLQVCKTQAQAAADAAALYAAEGIVGGTAATIRARAVAAAADNKVNGVPVVVDPNADVAFGIWDSQNLIFVPVASGAEASATAIQVSVHCAKSRGTQINMTFASLVGFSSADIARSAIASIGKVTTQTVPGLACPWLAGMPIGSSVPATGGNPTPAYAGINSPPSFSVTGGVPIRFAAAGGSTTWNPTSSSDSGTAGTEGDTAFIAAQAPVNGINTTYAPLNGMVGIFLDDNAPNTTAMAPSLDFSTDAERNFSTLSPQLKQVFYIGNGLDDAGNLQTFVAPQGATRLFIGTMDMEGWWWDNGGALTYTAVQGNDASLVR